MVQQFGVPVNLYVLLHLQNRASRYFLGVGKYTPTVAVGGDMGWKLQLLDYGIKLFGHGIEWYAWTRIE